MALAAGPLTPMKERGEGADGEGGSGDDQQDKGETWEGTEPLGGIAAGRVLLSFVKFASCSRVFISLKLFSALFAFNPFVQVTLAETLDIIA